MIKNSINLVLQGKSDVGKTFISSMLAQYFLDNKKIDTICADTDQTPFLIKKKDAISSALFQPSMG